MLAFGNLNSSLPAIFDDLFKPFKKNILKTPGEPGDMF